jgi:hypothetical protein
MYNSGGTSRGFNTGPRVVLGNAMIDAVTAAAAASVAGVAIDVVTPNAGVMPVRSTALTGRAGVITVAAVAGFANDL